MSNRAVLPENYQTCICGLVCKGRAALSNHGRNCLMEVERSRVFIELAHQGKTLTDEVFRSAWKKRSLINAIQAGSQ